jgi:hypothetical protein
VSLGGADPTKSYHIQFDYRGVLVAIENEGDPGRTFGPDAWILVNAHEWARAQRSVAFLQAIHERANEIPNAPAATKPSRTYRAPVKRPAKPKAAKS